MNISLVISTYNSPNSLLLVLKSVEMQSVLPNEVIIADDGSLDSTRLIIDDFKTHSSISVVHSWQEDKGFRVARSRNKAIARSSGEYIILIDGDVILHNKFLEDHLTHAEIGCFVQGSRVLLNEISSNKIISSHNTNLSFFSRGLSNRKNSIYSVFLAKLFSNKKNYLHGIKTCNMAFYKADCIRVNGFNNNFEGWGREDTEFVVRLLNNGVHRKNIRFNLIQFHLWHKNSSRNLLQHNELILQNSINNSLSWCDSGINSFL